MVGEIRDIEIVEIVIRVFFIGYLVLSILYVNIVVGVILCFLDMDVESFLIILFVLGVIF